jgi:hypothetical protein
MDKMGQNFVKALMTRWIAAGIGSLMEERTIGPQVSINILENLRKKT